MPRDEHRLAVALHGVEPATFEHCALIRDWLDDLGVSRVTLVVVPAADHPFYQRSPALAQWLDERRAAGDAIVRHAMSAQPERISSFDWWLAPGLWRIGTLMHKAATLRVDIHPRDFNCGAGRTRGLERTLRAASHRRRPVTYELHSRHAQA